jgi:hypothetical protein
LEIILNFKVGSELSTYQRLNNNFMRIFFFLLAQDGLELAILLP